TNQYTEAVNLMPTRYNTGEYSYDLEYHYGDMSASMEMLRARLIELLTPHLSGRYVKWREAYFTWFTKCGGGKIDISWWVRKRKSNVRLVRGLASFEMMGGGI
ncbi:hypothetical protein PV197_18945, partial [Acinetobacter baumannii]